MNNEKAILWALLTALIWGSAPVLFKLGLRGDISPLSGIFVHNLTATLFSLLFLILLRENPLVYPVKDIVAVAFGGFVSGFLGLLVYYRAVKEGDVSLVAPIASTAPLVSSLLAVLLLGESMNLLKLTGTVLIVAGAILLTLGK
ncbi:MAG: EamA family transporter [Aquificae bacterium]|nr:EamA family transporter [Aquificota bacterium]